MREFLLSLFIFALYPECLTSTARYVFSKERDRMSNTNVDQQNKARWGVEQSSVSQQPSFAG